MAFERFRNFFARRVDNISGLAHDIIATRQSTKREKKRLARNQAMEEAETKTIVLDARREYSDEELEHNELQNITDVLEKSSTKFRNLRTELDTISNFLKSYEANPAKYPHPIRFPNNISSLITSIDVVEIENFTKIRELIQKLKSSQKKGFVDEKKLKVDNKALYNLLESKLGYDIPTELKRKGGLVEIKLRDLISQLEHFVLEFGRLEREFEALERNARTKSHEIAVSLSGIKRTASQLDIDVALMRRHVTNANRYLAELIPMEDKSEVVLKSLNELVNKEESIDKTIVELVSHLHSELGSALSSIKDVIDYADRRVSEAKDFFDAVERGVHLVHPQQTELRSQLEVLERLLNQKARNNQWMLNVKEVATKIHNLLIMMKHQN